MTSAIRITKQTEAILEAILTDPDGDWWGSRIAPATGLKSGTLYPALMRMERRGWLSSRWEEIDPVIEGRPRKRLYRLTGKGELAAREMLEPRRAKARAPQRDGVWGVPRESTS